MMVLVDTPVWSLALRRRPKHLSRSRQGLANALAELIREGRAQMVGPIRQELLSGIREEAQFKKIRNYLRAFREPSLEAEDYEDAARMSNRCRSRGIAGSAVDFLICAAAHRRGWTILTTDRDFQNYAEVLPLRLHSAVTRD
ncbi:MAG TPA: PIN domain-containing protein [Terriglobales bacterium]|nr:PIN domain-containing protein [Terriglobales bacterium]